MKKTILFISALVLSGAATAQSGIKNAVVNVENDYTPEVIEVTKKNFTPEDNTETNSEPVLLIFSKDGKTYNGFTSETDIKDGMPQKETAMPGYIRLGYGLTNDIDAKAAYRLGVGKNGSLKAYTAFDGYRSDIDGLAGEWNSRLFKTTAGLGYTHRFNSLTLDIDGAFKNSVFNYQSTGFVIPGLTDKQDGQNYHLEIGAISHLQGAFSYRIKGDAEYVTRKYTSGQKEPIGEMRYGIAAGLGYEILSEHINRLGIDLGMDAYTYNGAMKSAGYNTLFSIDAAPYANLKFGNCRLKAGVRMNIITHGEGIFAIAPDIKVASNVKENITVYGSITGGRTENDLAKMESMTPYWGFDKSGNAKPKPTYRIADVKLGSRITFEPLSMEFNAGYAYTQDDLIQVMEQKNGFIYSNFAQDNTHHAYANLLLGYDLHGWLKMSADATYNYWNCKENTLLIMKPEVSVNLNAEARIIENLTFRIGYNYTHYTKTDNGRMDDKNDLYARISYQINKRFGAYIQGNNLLNCKYYDYAGYVTRGIRGSLGATVNF